MKSKIERILIKKYPNASKETIAKMTEIYLYISSENAKVLGRKR